MDRDRENSKRTLRNTSLSPWTAVLQTMCGYTCHLGKDASRSAVLRIAGDGLRGDTAFMLRISLREFPKLEFSNLPI